MKRILVVRIQEFMTQKKLSPLARCARVVLGQLKALPASELITPPAPTTTPKYTPKDEAKK